MSVILEVQKRIPCAVCYAGYLWVCRTHGHRFFWKTDSHEVWQQDVGKRPSPARTKYTNATAALNAFEDLYFLAMLDAIPTESTQP